MQNARNENNVAPSTPSRKRANKKYKLSYDINKTAVPPEKSPEFARYSGGDGGGPPTDNINLTDNINNKSVDSQSNIVKTGTDRKMQKRQLNMNHELLARPQLLPINSHATIGREDTNSKERHSQVIR